MSTSYKIAVDSGHGMSTAGKRTPPLPEDLYINGKLVRKKGERIHEKEWNKPTAEYLIAALNRCGFATCNVSPGTDDISLGSRVNTANIFKADCYISKHYNALTMDAWRDKTYFVAFRWCNGKPLSEKLGAMIASEITAVSGLPNCGCAKDYDYLKCELYVLKHSTASVAVLTESGFMDVWEDAKRMLDPYWQKADAEATCRAICKYYNVPYVPENTPASTPVSPTQSDTVKDVCWVGQVNSHSGLNLRENPDMSASIIASFDDGEYVVVTQEKNGWAHVQGCHNGTSYNGWMGKSYLTMIDYTKKEISTVKSPDGTLNIRAYTSSKYDVIRTMKNEEDFYILEDLKNTPYSMILSLKDNLPIIGYADSNYFFRHYIVKIAGTPSLNYRSAPNSNVNDNIIGSLGEGCPVEVYNSAAGSGSLPWLRVGSNGKILGYIYSKYTERI